MSYVDLRKSVNALGMVCSRLDNEIRIAFPLDGVGSLKEQRKRQEDSAYYTDDLADALGTALAMKAHGNKSKP